MSEPCCQMMKNDLEMECDTHDRFECPDSVIFNNPEKNFWGISIKDGGDSFYIINYCPWCGTQLSAEEHLGRAIDVDFDEEE